METLLKNTRREKINEKECRNENTDIKQYNDEERITQIGTLSYQVVPGCKLLFYWIADIFLNLTKLSYALFSTVS